MKPNNASLWFVVLTYNTNSAILKKLLTMLHGHNVVLSDNTQQKEHAQEIENIAKEHATYIHNEKNGGYTNGMNVGIRYAVEQKGEWVVLIQDDVSFTSQDIQELTEQLHHKKPGIYGPFPQWLDSQWMITTTQTDTLFVSGACMAIHRDVLNVIKEFYPDFFLFYEDADVCMQARKARFPVEGLALKGFKHQGERFIEYGSGVYNYYCTRNHLLFVERQAPLLIKMKQLFLLPYTLWRYRYYQNNAAYQGVLDFLFLRYGELKKSV